MMTRVLKASGIAIASVVITSASAPVASADELVDANVPFAFVMGGVRLEVGSYAIRQMADGSGVVAVVSADGRRFVCTTTIPSRADEPTAHTELWFRKFGHEYFLALIVPAVGCERVTPSLMERELATVEAGRSSATGTDAIP